MLGFLGGAPSVHAAEWSLAPSVSIAVDRDTNRALVPEGEDSMSRFIAFNVTLEHRTPRTLLGVDARLRNQDFDVPQFADDRSVVVGTRASWSAERTGIDLTASHADQSTLATDIGESSVFSGDTRRVDDSASVSAWHAHSERFASTFAVSHLETDFEGPRGLTPAGFRYGAATLQETYGVSPRLRLGVIASVSRVVQPSAGASNRSDSLRLSLDASLTDRTRLLAEVGRSRTRDAASSVDGIAGRAALTRQTARGALNLSVQQNDAPSDFGGLVRRREAALGYEHNLTERHRATLALRSLRDRDVLASRQLLERRADVAEATVDWRASERWSLGVNAGMVRAVIGSGNAVGGRGWRVALTANWSPQRRAISR